MSMWPDEITPLAGFGRQAVIWRPCREASEYVTDFKCIKWY